MTHRELWLGDVALLCKLRAGWFVECAGVCHWCAVCQFATPVQNQLSATVVMAAFLEREVVVWAVTVLACCAAWHPIAVLDAVVWCE